MPKPLNHKSSILVVGAGTWGSSIVLHLARRGYQNVTLLDPYPIPSAISAGNDVNKIAEQGMSHENYTPSHADHPVSKPPRMRAMSQRLSVQQPCKAGSMILSSLHTTIPQASSWPQIRP